MSKPRVRFTVGTLMIAIAVVAVGFATIVSLIVGLAQHPEVFQPSTILDALSRSPERGAIAVVLLLLVAWSVAFAIVMTVRAVRYAVSAVRRKLSRPSGDSGPGAGDHASGGA